LILFVGLILAVLNFLVGQLAAGQALALGALEFLGVFLSGWSLISFAVSKDMLEGQRFIAFFFALVFVVIIFAVVGLHPIGVTITHT